jgi:gluconate 2-dehydrogenase gamma chain
MEIDVIEQPITISRREFIGQLGVLASLAATFPGSLLAARRIDIAAENLPDWVIEQPWLTLSQVQEHLFPPADDAPGASDIRAIVYLHNTLESANADTEDKTFLVKGVSWLNDHTEQNFKQTFSELDDTNKERALREIEQSSAGRKWLSLLINYLIEALLADPVYGGNPGGVGWKWLGHQPGFPKPPENKTWYKLARAVHYRRKAGDA